MDLANKLFKGDRSVWVIFMLLCFISLVEVFSASSQEAFRGVSKGFFLWAPIVKHATFLLLGFGVILLLDNIQSKYFSSAIILLPMSIILLIATFFIGKETNEASRWLSIGKLSFQPSEIAKISCIVFIAFILSRKSEIFTPNNKFWIILIGVGMTFICIFPENFTTAFILFAVCFLMMFMGNLPWKKMFFLTAGLIVFVVLLTVIIINVPEKTLRSNKFTDRFVMWKVRVENFGKKESDEDKYSLEGAKFQPGNAKIAIARGGFFGRMPGRSIQRDFLPVAYSDFIYAIIIEELGLITGGIGVLLLYVFLMFRVAIIARRCEKQFPKYLALGSGLIIVIQAFINMSVAVGLIPVTGQPLPLISSGGTSTIITSCYIGIILSVSRFNAGMGNEKENESENRIEDVELDEGEKLVLDIQGIEENQESRVKKQEEYEAI
ncbi:MAG: FtsW/RodA/SpoVE family cell cycle protein [Tannerella sp.]|jgi:cell division protein FtsW|nr:FtsW/RodA/SpoVE family cell cycle protein [Tannerella sp.]